MKKESLQEISDMLALNERMENCCKKNQNLKESPNQSNGLLFEMAKLNHKDSGTSEFPPNLFRVWVQGDGSVNKPPHMHISNLQEGWEIKVYIETGELWDVVCFGRRKRRDNFQDIIKLVKLWFSKPTQMPGRIGTNQDAALNEWEACN